jgi:2-dehydro-3-deoxy-L-rhamnonate dehydrogenase (NAD+)
VSRAVIVTGGARGIGRALATRLAGERARLAIWDRDGMEAEKTATALGGGHLAIACDIADASAVTAATEATFSAFGRVDGLVNNAGILGPVAPLWEQTEEEFRRVTEVNQIGTFLVCRAVVPRLLQQVPDARGIRARIVNLSSIQAKDGLALSGAYSASKAAVIAMTKVLGKELAMHGIPVNAVTPVAAETDMAREITPARRADILSRIPMGRFIKVEEISAMIGWLLSDDCTFSTGAVFDLSGGRASF